MLVQSEPMGLSEKATFVPPEKLGMSIELDGHKMNLAQQQNRFEPAAHLGMDIEMDGQRFKLA